MGPTYGGYPGQPQMIMDPMMQQPQPQMMHPQPQPQMMQPMPAPGQAQVVATASATTTQYPGQVV